MLPKNEYFIGTDGERTTTYRVINKMSECDSVGESLDLLIAACFANTFGEKEYQQIDCLITDLEYCISELSTVKKNISNLLK